MLGISRDRMRRIRQEPPTSLAALSKALAASLDEDGRRAAGATLDPHEPCLPTRYVQPGAGEQILSLSTQIPLAAAIVRCGDLPLFEGLMQAPNFFAHPAADNEQGYSSREHRHAGLPEACCKEAMGLARLDFLRALADKAGSFGPPPDPFRHGDELLKSIGALRLSGWQPEDMGSCDPLRWLACGSDSRDPADVRACAEFAFEIHDAGMAARPQTPFGSPAPAERRKAWHQALLSLACEFACAPLISLAFENGAVPARTDALFLLRHGEAGLAGDVADRARSCAERPARASGRTPYRPGRTGAPPEQSAALFVGEAWVRPLSRIAEGSLAPESNEWSWHCFKTSSGDMLRFAEELFAGRYDFPGDDPAESAKGKALAAAAIRACAPLLPDPTAAADLLERFGLSCAPTPPEEALFHAKRGSPSFEASWKSFWDGADKAQREEALRELFASEAENQRKLSRLLRQAAEPEACELRAQARAGAERAFFAADLAGNGWAGACSLASGNRGGKHPLLDIFPEIEYEAWAIGRASAQAQLPSRRPRKA